MLAVKAFKAVKNLKETHHLSGFFNGNSSNMKPNQSSLPIKTSNHIAKINRPPKTLSFEEALKDIQATHKDAIKRLADM